LLTGETENSSLEVRTPRGAFSVGLSEIPYGKTKSGLDGKAVAERVPPFERITSDAQEQDQPAAFADSSGNIWLAYLEFKHNPDHDKIRNTPDNLVWHALSPNSVGARDSSQADRSEILH
jgi:hypothetical protein